MLKDNKIKIEQLTKEKPGVNDQHNKPLDSKSYDAVVGGFGSEHIMMLCNPKRWVGIKIDCDPSDCQPEDYQDYDVHNDYSDGGYDDYNDHESKIIY